MWPEVLGGGNGQTGGLMFPTTVRREGLVGNTRRLRRKLGMGFEHMGLEERNCWASRFPRTRTSPKRVNRDKVHP